MPADDWTTIREASDRLQKPVRTVRDAAARLPATYRRKADPLPLQVQFWALEAYLRGELSSLTNAPQSAQDRRTETEREDAGNTALLEQLRSENAFLRSQVEARTAAEGELRRLMLADKAELARLREQLSVTAGQGGEGQVEAEKKPRTFWQRLLWWRE